MSKSKIDNILSGISPAEKREILSRLVSSLISELNEAGKKELIKTVLGGKKEGRHLESMVEH